MPRLHTRLKKTSIFRRTFLVPRKSTRLKKKRPGQAVALIEANSDLVHPLWVAHFLVKAMESIYIDKNHGIRVHPEWVKVRNEGHWELGFFKYTPEPHSDHIPKPKLRFDLPYTDPRGQDPSVHLEDTGLYTNSQWTLLVLESLLQGYIKRSCLRLRRKRTSCRTHFWLNCLIQMASSIRYFRIFENSFEHCLVELRLRWDEWCQVD